MEQNKIIQIKQEILKTETEHGDMQTSLKAKRKMKNYSLISIPILLIIGIILASYEQTLPSSYGNSYYRDKPFNLPGLVIIFIFIPFSIILAIVGFIKAKKLKQPIKDSAENIMRLKNELIVLENSK
jgi:hypothetical protein